MIYDMCLGLEFGHEIKICSYPDYIFMLYLRLKDINNNNVYEGDIVEYDNSNWGYGDSKIPETIKIIVPSFDILYEDSDWDDYIFNIKLGKVIGNIYENPDLINR